MDEERARIANWSCEILYKILQWCWCCLFQFIWSQRILLPKKNNQQQNLLEDICVSKTVHSLSKSLLCSLSLSLPPVGCQWTELSHFNEHFRTHNVFMHVCVSVDFQFIAMLILENLSLWMNVTEIFNGAHSIRIKTNKHKKHAHTHCPLALRVLSMVDNISIDRTIWELCRQTVFPYHVFSMWFVQSFLHRNASVPENIINVLFKQSLFHPNQIGFGEHQFNLLPKSTQKCVTFFDYET